MEYKKASEKRGKEVKGVRVELLRGCEAVHTVELAGAQAVWCKRCFEGCRATSGRKAAAKRSR